MAVSRVIEVSFGRSSVALVRIDTAYFYNNGILFKPTDLDLPASYQVHWADSPQASSTLETIGTAEGAPIPDDLWDRSRVIYGWIYLHPTEDSGITYKEVRIYKNVRAGLPDGTEPTPAEQSTIDQAISALNTAVAKTAQDVESASQSAQSASDDADRAESARDTAGEYANDAKSSAASASTSASQASTSATASAQSASQSAQIKADVEDLADDAQGYANSASQSASQASASEQGCARAVLDAASAASIARARADEASGYAQTASTKASEAVGCVETATQKATEATQSAENASQSAQTAEQAKTASQTAQGLAESARDTAVQAKTDAESARDDAESARDEAQQAVASISGALADKAPVITDTASGAIASFTDGADNIPLKSLVVDIDPVQDLHGYESPWPAGGGKNLFGLKQWLDSLNITYTQQGEKFTITSNGSLYTNPWVFSDTDVEVKFSCKSFTNETATLVRITFLDTGGNIVSSRYADDVLTLNVTASKCRFDWSSGGTFSIEEAQIELGSTATAYAPYENLCPISGWTEVDVEQRGKNLCSNRFSDYTQPYDYRGFPIRLEKGQKYTFSVKLIGQAVTGCTLGITRSGDRYQNFDRPSPWQFVRSDGTIANATVTYTIDDRWTSPKIILYVSDEATFNSFFENYEVQLELGSTATPYSPYTGRSITINLGQTVYGGKLDVLSGELTVYPYYASYNGETLTGEWISDRDKYVSGTTPTIGAQVVNIEAQGVTVQLEPHEVESLYGVNNIWADSGDAEAVYRADTKLFIERLTAPDSADMIADANITSGQYFMVGNSLYKATANIANGGQIIVGTNCTRVSLAQALNEINV